MQARKRNAYDERGYVSDVSIRLRLSLATPYFASSAFGRETTVGFTKQPTIIPVSALNVVIPAPLRISHVSRFTSAAVRAFSTENVFRNRTS